MNKTAIRRALATTAIVGGCGFVSAPAAARDYDCSDFATHKQAQKFFKRHHPKTHPYRLDADHDGIACEDQR